MLISYSLYADLTHWLTYAIGIRGPNWAGRMHDNRAADMCEFWAAHFIQHSLFAAHNNEWFDGASCSARAGSEQIGLRRALLAPYVALWLSASRDFGDNRKPYARWPRRAAVPVDSDWSETLMTPAHRYWPGSDVFNDDRRCWLIQYSVYSNLKPTIRRLAVSGLSLESPTEVTDGRRR
jgi:hypothetical protein